MWKILVKIGSCPHVGVKKKTYLNPPAIVYNCKTSHLCVCVFSRPSGGRFFTITIRIHVMSTINLDDPRLIGGATIGFMNMERLRVSPEKLVTCEMGTKTSTTQLGTLCIFFVDEKNSNSHPLILHVNQPMIWKLECTLSPPSKGCCVIFVVVAVVGYIPWSTHSSFGRLRLQPCQGSPPVRGLCLSHWFSSMENKAFQWSLECMIDIWHIMSYKLFISTKHQALNHTLYTNESWIYNIVLPEEKAFTYDQKQQETCSWWCQWSNGALVLVKLQAVKLSVYPSLYGSIWFNDQNKSSFKYIHISYHIFRTCNYLGILRVQKMV